MMKKVIGRRGENHRIASSTTEERAPPVQVFNGPEDKMAVPVNRNLFWVYRYVALGVWLFSTLMMILDRFYWNTWQRQSVCTDGCGTDLSCMMDEAGDGLGCLIKGPWSVKVFDFIARVSARLIIATTSLMFLTMCHGTWNYLSEVEMFRPFLYRWRDDNQWLHTIGGWTMGIWVLLHVWSLLLPSMVDGYENLKVGGEIGWPLQVALPRGNIDVPNRQARWGVDDIWRIFWMTMIFGALMPLSRSAWALKKNFSLSMWLHMALGAGFFFDSWRRKTHPHVWFLNTPVVLWYLADKLWCFTRGRVDPNAEAKRIVLDKDYMLLLWKGKGTPKRICDIFWLKRSERVSNNIVSRTGEMSHPFTTCSSHDVVRPTADTSFENSSENSTVLPTIEPPTKTDVSWPGHRFSLKRASSLRSSGDHVEQEDASMAKGDVLVGVDTESSTDGDEISVVVNGTDPSTDGTGRSPASMQPRRVTPESETHPNRVNGSDPAALVQKAVEGQQQAAKRKNMVIKRLPTFEFQEFRKNEMDAGRLGELTGGGEWDKMAIMKINRRSAPKVRECSCMGYTHMMSSYRRPETAHIADLEMTENGGVPLRTYGPYRSEYGRLIEFPNLPPLLIIATGAGAALALDFIGYVRANKLVPARPVSICYSSPSLALLQFVTNTLLATRIPGIHIRTALTRHDDLELFDTTAEHKDDLAIGRLNVMSIMDAASAETECTFVEAEP
ncbi:unnamed protein product [Ascophyllum nodosum]